MLSQERQQRVCGCAGHDLDAPALLQAAKGGYQIPVQLKISISHSFQSLLVKLRQIVQLTFASSARYFLARKCNQLLQPQRIASLQQRILKHGAKRWGQA